MLRPGAGNQASAVWVRVGLAAPAVGHHSRRKVIGYDPALVMSVRVRARNTKALIPQVRRDCLKLDPGIRNVDLVLKYLYE